MTAPVHKEDIKAGLRKRFGTVRAFEVARGLPLESVADVLRGRSVKRTAQAIADELSIELQGCTPAPSVNPDDSASQTVAHRKIGAAA